MTTKRLLVVVAGLAILSGRANCEEGEGSFLLEGFLYPAAGASGFTEGVDLTFPIVDVSAGLMLTDTPATVSFGLPEDFVFLLDLKTGRRTFDGIRIRSALSVGSPDSTDFHSYGLSHVMVTVKRQSVHQRSAELLEGSLVAIFEETVPFTYMVFPDQLRGQLRHLLGKAAAERLCVSYQYMATVDNCWTQHLNESDLPLIVHELWHWW